MLYHTLENVIHIKNEIIKLGAFINIDKQKYFSDSFCLTLIYIRP